jgi:hypothetical protein
MPIPNPTSSETEKEFIKRCMADNTMVSEYTDIDPRFAVCVSSFNENTNNVKAAEQNKSGN